jgi:hypothetical protein
MNSEGENDTEIFPGTLSFDLYLDLPVWVFLYFLGYGHLK